MRKRILIAISLVTLCVAAFVGFGMLTSPTGWLDSQYVGGQANSSQVANSLTNNSSSAEQRRSFDKQDSEANSASNASGDSKSDTQDSSPFGNATPRQVALNEFSKGMAEIYRAYDDQKDFKRNLVFAFGEGSGQMVIEGAQEANRQSIAAEEKEGELYIAPASLLDVLGYTIVDNAVDVSRNVVALKDGSIVLPDGSEQSIATVPDSGETLWSARELAEALGCCVSTSAQGQLYINDAFQTARIIVNSNNAVSDTNAVKSVAGPDGMTVLQYESPFEAYKACVRFAAQPDVEYAEPDSVSFVADEVDNEGSADKASLDSAKNSEVKLQNTVVADSSDNWAPAPALSWGNAAVGSEAMQVKLYQQYGSIEAIPEVKVAVIDTGCDLDHELLESRLLDGYDFVDNDADPSDENGHGTHCAGIVVNNTTDNIKIIPVKSGAPSGWFPSDTVIYEGIEYAIEQGADVISMSFRGNYGSAVAFQNGSTLGRALSDAAQKNIVLVAAHGNDSVETSTSYPSCHEDVIAVSALDSNMVLASYSNYGSLVDLCAPGTDIKSSTLDGEYVEMSGTSMATPFVAACAALVRSEDKSLSRTAVLNRLQDSAQDLGEPGWDKYYGYGCVNVSNSIDSNSVARIGTTGYPTLAHALAAAQDGNEVVLTKDAVVSRTLEISKNITIRSERNQSIKAGRSATLPLFHITGNVKFGDGVDTGRTLGITCTESMSEPLISVAEGATLELCASLKVQASSSVSCIVQNKGVLKICGASLENTKEGTIIANEGNLTMEGACLRCASADSFAVNNTGVFQVSGCLDVIGCFNLSDDSQVAIVGDIPECNPFVALSVRDAYEGRSVLTAVEGISINTLPVFLLDKAWTLRQDSQAFVLQAQDSIEAKIGSKEYLNLTDALAEVQDGETITIYRDLFVTNTLDITKSISFASNGDFTLQASPLLEGALLHVKNGAKVSVACESDSSLLLNGMNVTRAYSLVQVDDGASLTLGKGAHVSQFISDEIKGVSAIHNDGNLVVDGAKITNNQASYGGGIYSTNTMRLVFGAISHNEAVYEGGGIYTTGNLVMEGGEVSDNKTLETFSNSNTYCGGGGISNFGQFEMTGGSVCCNSSEEGGGVNNGGNFHLKEGTISYNTAHGGYGGGINTSYGVVIISGGVVCHNEAFCGGGGVAYGHVRMTGGSVFDNTSNHGAEELMYISFSRGELQLEGGAVYSTHADHPVLIHWDASIKMSGSFTMSGGVINFSPWVQNEQAITPIEVSHDFTPEHPIELYPGFFSDNMVVVHYAENLQPDLNDFVLSDTYFSSHYTLKVNGQDLVCSKAFQVSDGWELNGTCEQRIDDKGALTVRPIDGVLGILKTGYIGNTDITKVVIQKGVIPPNRSVADLFGGCSNIEYADVSGLTNLSGSAENMFYKCSRLTELNIQGVDFSNVTNMSGMFCECSSLQTLDVSGFDTSKVTTMEYMFDSCSSLQALDVSSFDTSKVTIMDSMFSHCASLQTLDVSSFDTSKVTTMVCMFSHCASLQTLDVSSFDTSNVTNMYAMFLGCKSLQTLDVSGFDTSKVTNMSAMFQDCYGLETLNVSNFDTSKVTNMEWMFNNCQALQSLDVSNFDTSKVTNMRAMFNGCDALQILDVSGFDTSKVITMQYMFQDCNTLQTINLSSFDTSKVTDMSQMFNRCYSLARIYAGDDFSPNDGCDTQYMFGGCFQLVGGNGTNCDGSIIDGTFARIDRQGFPGYFTSSSDSFHKHVWDNGVVITDSTCTQDGIIRFTCLRDSSHIRDEVLPALGHTWSKWQTLYAADCWNSGTEYRTCSHCGQTEYRYPPATGHAQGEAVHENEVAPTCEISGSYDVVVRCQHCGEILSSTHEITPALGHTWDSGHITVPATTTSEGIMAYTCTKCSKTMQKSIPKLTPGQNNPSKDISSATVSGVSDKEYTGNVFKPIPLVKFGKTLLLYGVDYKLEYSNFNATDAGSYCMVVIGMGNYRGAKLVHYKIAQANNKVSVSTTSLKKTLHAASLKRNAEKITLPQARANFGNPKWKVTSTSNKKILFLAQNSIKIKKDTKSGTYVIKLKATVKGNNNYKSASSKTVKVKVTVTSKIKDSKLRTANSKAKKKKLTMQSIELLL